MDKFKQLDIESKINNLNNRSEDSTIKLLKLLDYSTLRKLRDYTLNAHPSMSKLILLITEVMKSEGAN